MTSGQRGRHEQTPGISRWYRAVRELQVIHYCWNIECSEGGGIKKIAGIRMKGLVDHTK